LFIIIVFSLLFISGRVSKAIEAMREFSLQKNPDHLQIFPEGELGDIGRRIVHLHAKNKDQKQRLQMEKDKLIKHFHYSDNGIAIFSVDHSLVYNNALFVQYSGIISPDNFEIHAILATKEFENVKAFVKSRDANSYSEILTSNERSFEIKVIMFDNFSFEVMLSDITLAEKNKKIKREMTQNIAHELKTPVSTIKGYLETLQNVTVSPEKQQHFLQRAKLQADRLSELVTDIALITKMEESPNLYPKERVLLNDVIDQATDSSKLKINVELNDQLYIIGSRNLLQTIFQNLIDNSNRYAGEGAEINITCYLQDEEYYYFSVYDTGHGIPEKFLNRIFERFYRIDEGRNRNNGGTGLGLSLVKNAILMHGGEMSYM
jgi:two-component system phosphate regulon sensor histidine kinase PhoR